jgi:hypothetical protein
VSVLPFSRIGVCPALRVSCDREACTRGGVLAARHVRVLPELTFACDKRRERRAGMRDLFVGHALISRRAMRKAFERVAPLGAPSRRFLRHRAALFVRVPLGRGTSASSSHRIVVSGGGGRCRPGPCLARHGRGRRPLPHDTEQPVRALHEGRVTIGIYSKERNVKPKMSSRLLTECDLVSRRHSGARNARARNLTL